MSVAVYYSSPEPELDEVPLKVQHAALAREEDYDSLKVAR